VESWLIPWIFLRSSETANDWPGIKVKLQLDFRIAYEENYCPSLNAV